jgi:hypothetical protein
VSKLREEQDADEDGKQEPPATLEEALDLCARR